MTSPILKGHVSQLGSLRLVGVDPGTEITGPDMKDKATVEDGNGVRCLGVLYLTHGDLDALVRLTKPLPTA